MVVSQVARVKMTRLDSSLICLKTKCLMTLQLISAIQGFSFADIPYSSC